MPYLPTTLDPAPDYHWSPTNQRAFLEHLAIVGSVTLAAKHVGMSARAAYDLKHRRDGAAFKLGWAAAVLIARGRLGDDLLERAIHGYDEEYVRTPADENGEVRIRRRRIDSRLGMEYLKRLDRMADGVAENGGELQLAQIIMGDWEAFLDRLAPADGEGGVAAVACWLAGRDNRFNPLSGLWGKAHEDCEVAQIPASSDEEEDAALEPILSPEEEAAEMSVWYCDYANGLRTDFPPPDDFDGDEDGQFGDSGYERSLSEDEERIQMAINTAANAPLREAGEKAREAWFSNEGADVAKAEIAEEAAAREKRQREREAAEAQRNDKFGPKPCHSREGGNPWSDVELENERCDVLKAQAMDSRFRGNDNEGLGGAVENTEAEMETKSEAPTRSPPEDPNIRFIHPKPNPYYPGSGRIPPWAERIC